MSLLPPHIPQCQHVRVTGLRCGSPALRGKKHCYYHNYSRQPARAIGEFEDAESIQLAVRQVINWIAQGMDTKRVALTLYALQIASSNLKSVRRAISWSDIVLELPEEMESQRAAAPAPRKKPSASIRSSKRRRVAASVGTKTPHSATRKPVPEIAHEQQPFTSVVTESQSNGKTVGHHGPVHVLSS